MAWPPEDIELSGSSFPWPARLGALGTRVQDLPPATPSLRGYRDFVIDANVLLSTLSLGTTVVGGGVNTVPVFCNGTNWIIA